MNPEQREQLHWLAFRYLAGELPRHEHDDFEQRLAHDAEASDAVARMVELTGAVRAAHQTAPVPVHPLRRRRLRRWFTAVACAWASLLAAVAGHWFLQDHEVAPAGRTPPGSNRGAELAVVWNATRLELGTRESENWNSAQPASADWPLAAEAAAAVSVPDWMLAAVVALEADPEGPGNDEG